MLRWRGFTLIELLVVTGIIALLTAIILPNYRAGERQLALERSAHKLAQDLRRTQEMAMSAKEFQGQTSPRYGIEFGKDRNYYILFADINDNGKYNPPPAPDIEVERITLEEGVKIQDLLTPSSKTQVFVAFKPPDPLTTIRDPGDRSILEIQLINANNQTKIVCVNKAGLVTVGRCPVTCAGDCSVAYPDGTCGPKKPAGEWGLPACQRCDGVSLTHVNIANNTQDAEGSNLCNQTCKKCSAGSCVNQLSSEDLFNQCGTTACYTGNCSGTGASCGLAVSGTNPGGTALSCSVTSGSCAKTTVFKIYATTNAHAELPSQTNYTYYVCCSGNSLGTSCSGNYDIALKLSSITNAHVEIKTLANYMYSACLSTTYGGSTIKCDYATDCSTLGPLYKCLASISGDTNAHAGNCAAYSTKVCCANACP